MDSKYWTLTEDFPTRKEIKEVAKTLICPKCGAEGMNVRWHNAQPFFGCSSYPDCRGSRNWTGTPGFQDTSWEDILKKEGKIDTDTPVPKRNQETTGMDWKQKFIEERAFVMQQLTDVKAAHTQRLHHCERLEKEIEALKKRVHHLEGGSPDVPEDNFPF